MSGVNFTKEELDALLECVSTKYKEILEERVSALPNLQKDLNSATAEDRITISIKDNNDIDTIKKYFDRKAILEEQSKLFSGLYEKLMTIYGADNEGKKE